MLETKKQRSNRGLPPPVTFDIDKLGKALKPLPPKIDR